MAVARSWGYDFNGPVILLEGMPSVSICIDPEHLTFGPKTFYLAGKGTSQKKRGNENLTQFVELYPAVDFASLCNGERSVLKRRNGLVKANNYMRMVVRSTFAKTGCRSNLLSYRTDPQAVSRSFPTTPLLPLPSVLLLPPSPLVGFEQYAIDLA